MNFFDSLEFLSTIGAYFFTYLLFLLTAGEIEIIRDDFSAIVIVLSRSTF